ncbi:MAG: hypothetical protein ACREID_05795, partial [Planctomycetota bacterium]
GFTVLEVAFAGLFFATLIGATAVAVASDNRVERVLTADLGPEMRAHRALEVIVSDLRMASVNGEDRDADGYMDVAEDVDGDGVLDVPWSLADGATGQTTLMFNRRIDLLDAGGALLASGVFSEPILYSLQGNRIIRNAVVLDPVTATARTLRSTVAEGVTGLRFSRTGALVTVAVDLALPPGVYASNVLTMQATARVRN